MRPERYVTLRRNAHSTMQTLISADQIAQRVREMATQIHLDHPNGVHLVCVLKGAFVFLSDLARAMPGDCSLDFMAVSSSAI